MKEEEAALGSLVKNTLGIVHTEDLMLEAVRDLLRDEVKRYIRARLEERPALKEELKRGVAALMEAKVREASALVLMAKAAAKLGVELVPAEVREEVAKEFVDALERDIATVLEDK
ncbi:MAG: hypothetical protein ACE5JE_03620 [Thermoplasmata archaeon]